MNHRSWLRAHGHAGGKVILLHETWRWTGDDDLVRELMPNARRALDWIDDYGDLDGDGRKRRIPTVSSNAGHLLWSRVPRPEQAMQMAQHLLGTDLFSGWGIRTLSDRTLVNLFGIEGEPIQVRIELG